MKAVIIGIMAIWLVVPVHAQMLSGKVFGKGLLENELLAGASVVWIYSTEGTTTNENGVFKLSRADVDDPRLVISFVGYQNDTIVIKGQTYLTVVLTPSSRGLGEVTVRGQKPGSYLSSEAIKTEVISAKELTKAACCDLAGCFETQATVQPQTTNVLTNSRELRILGISGVYNQVLFDGMPLVQGLSYTYGISSYPGTLIGNIYVSKGANSVLQGFESISGQINIEPKEPDRAEKLLLNGYVNSFLERHLNANFVTRVGKNRRWSTLLAGHTVQPAGKVDRDEDTFLDVPRLTRYLLYNQWKYGRPDSLGLNVRFGLRYLWEGRVGGQTFFDPARDRGSSLVYGQDVRYSQPELYIKTGYRFNERQAFSLMASAFHQNQHSYFGTVRYDAQQTNGYANLQYELDWGASHQLKTGISLRSLQRTEIISFSEKSLTRTYAGAYQKRELIPGVFAENTFHWLADRLVWIAGVRLDHHNQFGYFLTPRTLLKYDLTPEHSFRASIGTGWRTANLFSENLNLLASSRDIVFAEALRPEQAVNWGVNYTRKIEAGPISGTLGVDFYQTRFSNQVFPDYDSDPTKAIIGNFTGPSLSNSLQVEANLQLGKVWEARLAYNYLDVYRITNESKYVLPFNPKHRVMAALSFRPVGNRWYFDVNAHYYGRQQLPSTEGNPVEYQRSSGSKPYALFNAQVTRLWQGIEVYVGGENLFDFRQLRPINGWQQPFSPYFDTSLVWGPTRGRELYVGIRYKMK